MRTWLLLPTASCNDPFALPSSTQLEVRVRASLVHGPALFGPEGHRQHPTPLCYLPHRHHTPSGAALFARSLVVAVVFSPSRVVQSGAGQSGCGGQGGLDCADPGGHSTHALVRRAWMHSHAWGDITLED